MSHTFLNIELIGVRLGAVISFCSEEVVMASCGGGGGGGGAWCTLRSPTGRSCLPACISASRLPRLSPEFNGFFAVWSRSLSETYSKHKQSRLIKIEIQKKEEKKKRRKEKKGRKGYWLLMIATLPF